MAFSDPMASSSFFGSESDIHGLDDHHAMSGSSDLDYSSFTSSDCPSLSSSLSIVPPVSGVHRRQSVTSSVSWEPRPSFSVSSLDTTAPPTPVKTDTHPALDMMMSDTHCHPLMGGFDCGYCFSIPEQVSAFDHPAPFPKWFDESTLVYSDEQTQATPQSLQQFPYAGDGRYNLNSCFSRPIFQDDIIDDARSIVPKETSLNISPWVSETMDPSKAFLEPVTPPRPFNTSPISPMTLDPYTPTPMQLKTSPVELSSPLELRSHRRPVRSSKKTLKRAGSLLNSLPPVIRATTKFRCDHADCKDKAFKRAEHLKRHMKCHSTNRPFKCELCGRGFSRSDNRRAHYDTHGNKSKGRNAYYPECDPESNKFKYGKKANASKGRVGVRSKLWESILPGSGREI